MCFAANLSHGSPASAIRTENIVEQVWVRELWNGDIAVCFFNRDENPRNISIAWVDADECTHPVVAHGQSSGSTAANGTARNRNQTRMMRDIWKFNSHGANIGAFVGGFKTTVQPHRVVMLRVAQQ
jgi:hypothetical protein